MKEKLTYTEAYEELNSIVAAAENDEISIDELQAKVKRASELISFCRNSVKTTNEHIEKVFNELNSK
mgnify:FL=1